MVVNFTNFKTFRICKRCKSNKTAIQKNRYGKMQESWYIDKESPEGGWVCYSCYHNKKVNSKYMTNEIEFDICSNNLLMRVLLVH